MEPMDRFTALIAMHCCPGREEPAADDLHVVQPGVDRLPAVLEHLRVRRRGQRRHPATQPLDT